MNRNQYTTVMCTDFISEQRLWCTYIQALFPSFWSLLLSEHWLYNVHSNIICLAVHEYTLFYLRPVYSVPRKKNSVEERLLYRSNNCTQCTQCTPCTTKNVEHRRYNSHTFVWVHLCSVLTVNFVIIKNCKYDVRFQVGIIEMKWY